jgi:hypothetical protein
MSLLAEVITVHRVSQIGAEAYAALLKSDGMAHPITGLEKSSYFYAGGQLVWAGQNFRMMHPRTIILDTAVVANAPLRFDIKQSPIWRAERPRAAISFTDLPSRCRMMCSHLARIDPPKGFGLILSGRQLDFPLSLIAPHARAVAHAYKRDDPYAVLAASRPLLGVGLGLTPSGDDFTGAALFGHRQLSPSGLWPAAWTNVARELAHATEARSHPVSAALFSDLANGQSFAVLHELAHALLEGATPEKSVSIARRVVAMGHSSGWDMLAGLIAGMIGDVYLNPEGNEQI